MIASERSLTSAHQSQQHRKPTAIGNVRNGAAKPPVRPVKIYVIDPRKLQQRLEAYVDQKNQKRVEVETEKERLDNKKSETVIAKTHTPTTTSLQTNRPTTANKVTITSTPTKTLPTLAPKLPLPTSSPVANLTNISLSNHESTILGNGVTLINGASLNLPALPLVVSNGVALIQPAISHSSMIPTGGLFLPGITAIPSVVSNDGTLIRPSQQHPHQINAKQRYSATQKRKVKKKKAAKKRKLIERKEKDDEEDDSELSYLLKETTTRLGRISRPVSQPHSPLVKSQSAASSRAPSPSSKRKKKVSIKEDATLKCDACVQVFVSREKLNGHLKEFPLHRMQDNTVVPPGSLQIPKLTSTNTNIQGPITISSIPLHTGTIETTTKTASKITLQSTTENTFKSQSEINGVNDACVLAKSTELPNNVEKLCNPNNFNNLPENACGSLQISSTDVTRETLPRTSLFSAVTNSGQRNLTNTNGAYAASSDKDREVNSSLVPTSEEHNKLFQRCMTLASSVVQVPSSYSIPSSPPSRCQSPESPIFVETNLLSKRGGSSPVAACDSPIDPMLLHSRSPFQPPMPETSSHSVSASNLSIPEESLCKGELFMDLGGGALENTSLSTISPTPFGNDDTAIGQLFVDSVRKEPERDLHELRERPSPVPNNDIEKETSNSAPGSPGITPMLLETTEDANDGEIFQTANYTRTFLHPSVISSKTMSSVDALNGVCEERSLNGRSYSNCNNELPRTPQSVCLESDVSMDSSETTEPNAVNNQKCRSVWKFVKDQIKFRGISQACGEISEMADKLSRIARDHFIPIREEEIERLGNSSSIIHVETPFFSHLLDLPFGMYIFKEDVGKRKKPTPPPITSSELSFTGGVEDVEKFLPPDIDLISLPHLTNLDLT